MDHRIDFAIQVFVMLLVGILGRCMFIAHRRVESQSGKLVVAEFFTSVWLAEIGLILYLLAIARKALAEGEVRGINPIIPIALLILIAIIAVPTGFFMFLWWKKWNSACHVHRLAQRGLCRACGYDLRATPDRCPECGTVC